MGILALSGTIYLQSGATEATISSALAGLAQGGTLVFPKDATIRISKGLQIDISGRDITLDLNGSTLKQAGDVEVISATGRMAAASSVRLSMGDANTTISYAAAPSGVAVGDWIKVVSDDVLPHDNINTSVPTRLGQAMKVLSVDGNKVTLEGKPLYGDLYKTNVRAAEIKSGTFSVVNGTVEGDRSHPKWVDALVYVRNGIDTHIENLTVKDGNSMGINLVNNVNALVIDSAVMNLRDDTAIGQYGYGVHSAMSVGTTVIGLYGERTRHVTDNNGVGIKPNQQDLSKYGADIGMTVKDTVAYNNSAFSYSWHSEGNQGVLDNVMSFDSHGFVGVRGVGNKVLNSASIGDERGLQFFEYGDGDARDMVVDNLYMKEAGLYAYVVSGTTTNNVISNSSLEYDYRPGLLGPTKLVNTTVTMTDGNDNDTMTGTGSADRLLGGRGTDLLKGNGGNDYLWGGAGTDTLTGGSGQDRFAFHQVSEAGDIITDFRAGRGGDVLDLSVMDKRYEWHGDIFQDGYVKFVQSGGDTLLKVDVNGGGDGYVTLATLKDVSAGSLTAANVQISMITDGTGYVSPTPSAPSSDPEPTLPPTSAPATPSAPVLGTATHVGTAGSDDLQGSSGNDILKGLAGNDYLLGRVGNDILEGGTGSDILVGGDGIDTASYVTAATAVKASLDDARTNLGDAKGDIYYGVENLLGSAYGDVLQGNGSMNGLAGGAGDDTLSGMNGMDTLWGEAGDDRLYGGNQNDTLIGGLGRDILVGGADRDTFVFQNAAEGGDTLADFVHAFDKIKLGSAFGFPDTAHVNFVAGGNQPFEAKATLLYDQDTGVLSFDADGSGSGHAVVVATLSNHAALTASDFIV